MDLLVRLGLRPIDQEKRLLRPLELAGTPIIVKDESGKERTGRLSYSYFRSHKYVRVRFDDEPDEEYGINDPRKYVYVPIK